MGILRTDKISGLQTPTVVTGSVDFDGNDHLSIGNSGNFNFLHNGATDWTVEFWAKTGATTRQFVWGTAGSSAQTGFYLQIMSQADGQADAPGIYAAVTRGASGNYINWGANNVLSTNTWHHIAAVFKSSDKTLALYVDGKEVDNDTGTVSGTFAAANYSSGGSSYAFTIGKNLHGGGNYMNGEISNLRVVSGRRLYTSDFTPPVHALEPIDGTRILCCNNPDSVTAVSNAGIGTAHIATTSGDPTVATDNPSLTRDFTGGTEFSGVTTFDTQGYFVPPSGTTEQRGRGRGLIGSGYVAPSRVNTIDYITIQSEGNAQDFGDLTVSRSDCANISSSTRGIFAGGIIGYSDVIDFVTIATTSNAVDFGDISAANQQMAGVSNSTRGLIGGGKTPASNPAGVNTIDYITIASLGDAQDFGDLLAPQAGHFGTGSATRGIFAGGYTPAETNVIQYVTIASLGDALDFGDLTLARGGGAGGGNSIRGLFYAGYSAPALRSTIDYITIASTGNAQDFGDASSIRGEISGCCSIPTRGVFSGGNPNTNTIEYVTIASTGDAKDFGDLTQARRGTSSLSDSHGGIS